MKYLKKIVAAVSILLVLAYACAVSSYSADGKAVMANKPEHHAVDGFRNHPFVETAAPKGVAFYLRRFWNSVFVPDVPEGHAISESESIHLLNSIEGDKITWLGHASFLIKMSGKTILTDPFLTEFASPVSWAGPRRFVEPGVPLGKLPAIDMVVVSHNHYDHLDDETVRKLKKKDRIHVVVPLGLKHFFAKRGYQKITELDWSESVSVGSMEITSLPAVHDSARSTDDHNQTLWSSWAITSPENKILFIGDTGYSDTIFREIGNQYGSFDYAILPIGAYEPRELMWMSHVTPEEAVAIGNDVGAKALIASHWGTVSSLSDEPVWEPPARFRKAGIEGDFSEESLWVMKVGETRPLSREYSTK